MIEPFRNTFSRPVNSGWNPAPISMRAPSLPRATKLPVVGTVTWDRILSRVLLPAPFLPTNPSTSPFSRAKVTSFKAQKSSRVGAPRMISRFASRSTSSRIDLTCQPRRKRYRFDTLLSSITG